MELGNKTKTKQVAGYFPTLRHFDLSSCKSGKALVYFILSSFEALFLRSQKNRKGKKTLLLHSPSLQGFFTAFGTVWPKQLMENTMCY